MIERRVLMIKEKKENRKFPISSIVMYSIGTIAALIAIAALVNDVRLFKATVSQYVAQGYAAKDVASVFLAQQLLPGIFQAVALYGGIAAILIFGGIINTKLSKCLKVLNKEEACENIIENIEECEACEETTDLENENIKQCEETIDVEDEIIQTQED